MKRVQSGKLETLVHLLTAAVLLSKGLDKLTNGSQISGGIILSLGVLVLCITIFHKTLNISHIRSKWIVYLVEAIALLMVAILYLKEGKVYLPYFYFMPSFVFFVLSGFGIGKDINHIR